MTAAETAEVAAEYAAPWIERLARAGFAAKALLYATVGALAARMALGNGGRATGARGAMESVQNAPLGITGGRSLLWIIAISIGVFGVYQLYRAFAAKLSSQLQFGKISAEIGRWIIGVSRIGIAARGIVFAMVALLLAGAAMRQSPSRAGGIDDALESLTGLGKWPFMAIAVGLIAYGLYELLNARYRRIRVLS